MGFFSWKCAVSKKSIPAFPYADLPVELSTVVMILPDGKTISGIYDGYGNIGDVDVYEVIAPYYFGDGATRKDVFNNKKYITNPISSKKSTVEIFNWEKEFVFEGRITTLNRLVEDGYEIEQDFYLIEPLIKIVMLNEYNGETYDELESSERCPDQGYFYEDYYEQYP